jgi:hypothetical protein
MFPRHAMPMSMLGEVANRSHHTRSCFSSRLCHHRAPLLRNLNTTNRTKSALDITINSELASSQSPHHEQTRTNTAIRAPETQLLRNLDQTAGRALPRKTLGLVDLAQHGVGGLRDDGGGETGNEAGAEVDGGVHARGGLGLVEEVGVGVFGDFFVDDEFGHGVWDPGSRVSCCSCGSLQCLYVLLEQNGAETRVESAHALLPQDLAEPTNQAIGKARLRHQSNTRRLERAERNIGEELGERGRSEVDGCAVLGRSLVAEEVDGLRLEELVAAELESALEEVAGKGWADTGQEGTGAVVGDDLADAADKAAVVGDGVELNAGLDAVVKYVLAVGVLLGRWLGVTYTSTGVIAPCVMEQQTAPAKAKRE